MSSTKSDQQVSDARAGRAYASGEASTVIDSLVKVCIAVSAAGIIAMFNSVVQLRADSAGNKVEMGNISEKVNKLETRVPLTASDLTTALLPLQTLVTQHTADIADNKKWAETMDRRVGVVESDLGYIRRDIGTITDVLKNGQGNEQPKRR